MKNKKRNKIIVIIGLSVLILLFIIYLFKFNLKNPNSLSLEENKWIDENKYNVVDMAIINDIPVLSYEGDGLIYDYLDYVTKNHSLKFNVVPQKLNTEIDYEYKINIVDEISKNDIDILKDNMVFLTISNIQYKSINDINNLKIGVLNTDKQKISEYLNNESITYVEYNSYNDLKNSIINSKLAFEQGNSIYDVDGIIILKTIAIKEIIENNLNVASHFNDLSKYFVLTTKGNSILNSILKKTLNSWKLDDFNEKYDKFLLSEYYNFKKLTDVEQKTIRSKDYVYGFVNYGIYNYLNNNKISGINAIILKEFKDFSNLSITYTQYNSISKLLNDFNNNKIDFMFNIINNDDLKAEVYKTINFINRDLLVVSNVDSNIVVDNIKSLKDKELLAVKYSYIEKYLKDNQIKYKSYNDFNSMLNDFGSEDILIIDVENYNYYKSSKLKNTKINYIMQNNQDYNFIINNKESNKLFEDLFNFYISFNPIDKVIANDYEIIAYKTPNLNLILILIILILVFYIVLDFYNHIKTMVKTIKKSKKIKLSKEEKIMYIDQLTSLKNRAYFNSRIESWDDSEVYPQSIIVIDLNNISYINDNYGREEGDKVITEAANILIQNQLSNSEIIRTDGNEFLIYLVGYNEKQIITYLRKLSKEFKNLSHGFGAASGYSIITDAIKTLDDAVNEATLAMKENKEDIDY